VTPAPAAPPVLFEHQQLLQRTPSTPAHVVPKLNTQTGRNVWRTVKTRTTHGGRRAGRSSRRQPAYALPADGSRAAAVLAFALAQVGTPYRWGAAGNGGFDCSGLVMASYRRAGVSLPHQSGAISNKGRPVPQGQWQPGDVIAMPHHVAIYVGHGQMVEAPKPGKTVRVTKTRGGTARRIL